MKRIGHIWQQVVSMDNLRKAVEEANRNLRPYRRVEVSDEQLLILKKQLIDHTWRPTPFRTRTIYEKKERHLLTTPVYPDHIVHHAMMQVVRPLIDRVLTYNTHSCIPGRGITSCKRQTEQIIRSFRTSPKLYALTTDVRKFYESIDNDIMKLSIRRIIKDPDLLWLIDLLIDSCNGLPIGSYYSGYFSNLYMAPLMHYINEVLPYDVQRELDTTQKPIIKAVEYADDIPMISNDKQALHIARRMIALYLSEHLHLTMKPNWQVFPVADSRSSHASGRAIDFVGFCFYRNHTTLRKGIKKNLARKVSEVRRQLRSDAAWQNGRINRSQFLNIKRKISPWLGWIYETTSANLMKKVIINPLKLQTYESKLRSQALHHGGRRRR